MNAVVAEGLAHRALADEVRALVELVATHEFSDADADAARRSLAHARASLEARSSRVSTTQGDALPHWPVSRSAVSGPLNPYAPPVEVRNVDDIVEGTITYPRALQGPPEHAHGGHVAMVFDHLAGRAAGKSGKPIVTGRLSVRYLRPTPVGKPIRFTARVTDSRHSLVTVECAAHDGETKTASAEITFVELGPAHFEHAFGALLGGKKS